MITANMVKELREQTGAPGCCKFRRGIEEIKVKRSFAFWSFIFIKVFCKRVLCGGFPFHLLNERDSVRD